MQNDPERQVKKRMQTEKRKQTPKSESLINKKLDKPKKNTRLNRIINQLKCNKRKSTNNRFNLTFSLSRSLRSLRSLANCAPSPKGHEKAG
jgi:hypothetical protein